MILAPEFELCAETLQACGAAREGGADRIELCSALSEGGVTPSRGLLRAAIAEAGLPVHVLLRPREGDFVYTDSEFAVLCDDLQDALALGAAGVVTGILLPSREVDLERMRIVVELAAGKPVTFHRAFDQVPVLPLVLEQIIAIGCARVLTSGGKQTAPEAVPVLAALAEQAGGRIRLAAGGGVTVSTAHLLRSIPNLDFHASLRRVPAATQDAKDPLWRLPAQAIRVEDVRAMANIVHGLQGDVIPLRTQELP